MEYKMSEQTKKISFILPCLNESAGLKIIIPEIIFVVKKYNLDYEIILTDNNSQDKSITIFKKLANDFNISDKTKVVLEKREGYGSAYQAGFDIATGDIFIMADSDGTYDFKHSIDFINEIEKGFDMVIGNRFSGNMQKGSMPILNKFLGNPILSFLVRLFFNTKVKDVHSGMRAITKEAYKKMDLYTTGMEFASEMIISASKKNLKISEIDINYRNRHGHSKLKAFRDGWKHLRFILVYSPYYVFFLPGLIFFFLGFVLNLYLYFFDIKIINLVLQTHPMFFASIVMLFGYQLIFFSMFNKFYAICHLGDYDSKIQRFVKFLTLEKMLLIGAVFLLISLGILFKVTYLWISNNFGSLNQIENLIWAINFFLLAIQTIFSSLMISIIGIKEK